MWLIDIGNTSIHIAKAEKGKLKQTFRIATEKLTSYNLNKKLSASEKIIISSVVPWATKLIKKTLKNQKIFVLGENISIPIRNFYNKKEIGMDRLVNAYAAKEIYRQARIVIDFGTAITLDFISKQGNYLGGIIIPGINLSLKALNNCALIKQYKTILPNTPLIPKNTHQSISRGLYQGNGHIINGFINYYQKKLKFSLNKKAIILTGGDGEKFKKLFSFPCTYDPLLTLKGLFLLSKQTS